MKATTKVILIFFSFFILIGIAILSFLVRAEFSKEIKLGDAGAIQWKFETLQEDAVIETLIEEINLTTLRIIIINKTEIPNNYIFRFVLCENEFLNNTRKPIFNKINIPSQALNGINNTWCNEVNNKGFIFISHLPKPLLIDILGKPFILELPNNLTSFKMYVGGGTEVILGGARTLGMAESQNEKIIRDSYGLHIFYDNGNADLVYYNSTNNSTFNTQVVVTGSVIDVNAVQDSNGNIHVLFYESGAVSNIQYINKTSAGVWGTAQIVMDLGQDTNEMGMMSWAIDSDNGIHGCIVTAVWNSTVANDFLIYINYSASQGWWGDNTVVNGTATGNKITYNGTWVNSVSTDDTDECDIEVDTDGNVYIVGQGSGQTDLDIWSNRDSRNTTRGGFDQRYQIDSNGGSISGVSISVSPRYNTLHVAYANGTTAANTDMSYANNTAANWNTSWTRYSLDTATSGNPSIKVSHDMNVFIVYENTTTNAREIFYANSTVNATSALGWTNRSTLKPRQTWQQIIEPLARGSTFPRRNSLNDSLEFIYWNDTDNNLYFDQLAIPFNPLVAVAAGDTCTPPSNTNWTINAPDNCVISGQNINVTRIFINGRSGTVIFRNSNITSLDCRIEPNPDAIQDNITVSIETSVSWGNAC